MQTEKSTALPTQNAGKLYQQHCQSCHGQQRLGGMGPALLPENLQRLRRKDAVNVIRHGRVATQMPAFGQQLNDAAIAHLIDFIYRQPTNVPAWPLAKIEKSHRVFFQLNELKNKPLFNADPLNLFIVVEQGDHHATVLDGDKFEALHRFKTHFALHGGPKYSPTGRFVYFASRDGWISKFDIYNLKTVAEIRAGINTRNIAVSSDGKLVMVANYLPHNLVVLNSDTLNVIKIIDAREETGNHPRSSRVSAVYNAPPRQSFIAALKDIKEVWEIPYATLTPRRIPSQDYLDDFFFSPDYQYLIGSARKDATSRDSDSGQVINLAQGKRIKTIALPGMPHLGSGITWNYRGKAVLATPHIKEGVVSVIDMTNWQVLKRIDTQGPGFFMRSHEKSPYAWVDVFFGRHRDVVHVVDKASLTIVKTLRPVPGKTAAHVEFTKDGRYALLSIWDRDGAIIVYDANTLEEVKRLPMSKPSGKYNVYNKIHYSRGTSH